VACEAMNRRHLHNPLQKLKLIHLLKEETFGTLINLSKLKRRQNYRLHDNIITYCMVKCQTVIFLPTGSGTPFQKYKYLKKLNKFKILLSD
jgi:hypothetical protein